MNPLHAFHQRLGELLERSMDFVVVTIVDAHGSIPADVGSRMIVTAAGLDFGTVGGGRVEAKAIDQANAMLLSQDHHQLCDWSLKADVGMTCGGRIKLFFETWTAARWQIVIFGAGHVTQALARLLVMIPCQVTCVDPRHDWLSRLPDEINRVLLEHPEDYVENVPTDAFVLCMTKGHHSDFPVLQRIFQREQSLPFLGVIGSRAKAAVLRSELVTAGIAPDAIEFHCPVGLLDGGSPIGSHHPSEIAVSIAAQLLQIRGRQERDAKPSPSQQSF